jgi:hypothetical protein
MRLLEIFTHFYLSFLVKNKQTFVIFGLRRAGNHAFINWLASSIENSHCEFKQVHHGQVLLSKSKDVIFLNESNWYGTISFFYLLRQHKKEIKDAKYVFISLEDYIPRKKFDPYAPKKSRKIKVIRSTLNLIASRVTRSISQAKKGLERGDMQINNSFFRKLYWFYHESPNDWLQWNYDEWLSNSNNYQLNFLKLLKITNNISPKISNQGGGSSFSGQSIIPDISDLKSRMKIITWPDIIIERIIKDKDILNMTTEEVEFIEKRKIDNNK